MSLELALFGMLLGAALMPLLALVRRAKCSERIVASGIVAWWTAYGAVIVAVQFLPSNQPVSAELRVTNRPIQRPTNGFVGSAACRACHAHEHATWHDSYHRTMTQAATEQSVIGDFEDVRLSGKELNARLFKEGAKFMVEMNFAEPRLSETYPVVMTTGSHNRQVYWLGIKQDPRLAILPWMYLKAERRWIPRHAAYINAMCLQEKPELAVFKADFDRWRHVCIKCHATHGRPYPIDPEGGKPRRETQVTQAAEFGISCEACHGPGAAHVAANRSPLRRYGQHFSAAADPTIVNPANLPHDRSAQVCGQCHGVIYHRDAEAHKRWLRDGYTYRPGADLHADPTVFIMRGRLDLLPPDAPKDLEAPSETGSFWSDGMNRATGREYNSLLDSPCFQRGKMSCLSCHEMHQARGDPRQRADWADDQLKRGMDGNQACVQCHERFRDAERLTQHTRHAVGSSGSECYNCHMPFTSYGLLKAIRSHQIDSPSVEVSLRTGRPNACNQCHLDKTLSWTADYLNRWHKITAPKLSKDERQIAASVLWTLRGDAGQRALMAWSFGWQDALAVSGNHWQAPFLAQLLDDRFDAVRFIALRSLKRLPGFSDFDYDFVGPPGDRAAAAERARQIWEASRNKMPRQDGNAMLLDDQGRLMSAEFQRLWRQRDDRAMAVNE